MNRVFGLAVLTTIISAAVANAATVGEPSPLANGSVDGWSGVSVLDGYGSVPSGQQVTAVSYYAAAGRADGSHHVQPLIIKKDGANHSIWDIGPVLTPAASGEHSANWSSKVVPSDGGSYLAGFWQWRQGVDDDNGGVVAFADAGGDGMFQENEIGTSYVPAIGDAVASGHASAAGGRAYQFNYTTAVPEPASIVLAGFALLGLGWIARRRK